MIEKQTAAQKYAHTASLGVVVLKIIFGLIIATVLALAVFAIVANSVHMSTESALIGYVTFIIILGALLLSVIAAFTITQVALKKLKNLK